MEVAIVGIPLDLAPGQHEFEVTFPEGAVVRAVLFALKKPRLVMVGGSAQLEERPVMFVEVDGNQTARTRTFALIATNEKLTPRDHREPRYVTTAFSQATGAIAHLFELVEPSS